MKRSIILIAVVFCKLINAQICFDPMRVFKPVGRISSSASIVSADFNGDGNADLATTNNIFIGNIPIGNIAVLLGTGTGNFTIVADTCYVDYYTYQIINADFNKDGKVDLATVGGNGITISLGTGTGAFVSGANYWAGYYPTSLTTADFNGDGFADLASGDSDSGKVWVLMNNGAGNFSAATGYKANGRVWSIISTDFNNDGKADLATANGGSNNVSVFLGTGTGSLATANSFTVGVSTWAQDTNIVNADGGMAQSLASADFNGDGNADIVAAHDDKPVVTLILGDGTGGFGVAADFMIDSAASPSQVMSADFNGDGKADLATANSFIPVFITEDPYSLQLVEINNTISVLLGTGTGSFVAATSFTVGNFPQWAASSDFNGDGKADIAVCDSSASVLLSCSASGIQTLTGSNLQVNIYPNPTGGTINIELSAASGTQKLNSEIEITDLLGEKIFQSIQPVTRSIIDLSSKPAGVYFISIKADGKKRTQKLIKY